MFNPLPLLALGAVAVGYFGAVERTDRAFDAMPQSQVAAYPASQGLSVEEFVGQLPQTVQDPLCDTKDVITVSLSGDFAETMEASWTQRDSGIELWASDLMGTWTLLHVNEDGLACIVQSGFGWQEGMTPEAVVQGGPLS